MLIQFSVMKRKDLVCIHPAQHFANLPITPPVTFQSEFCQSTSYGHLTTFVIVLLPFE